MIAEAQPLILFRIGAIPLAVPASAGEAIHLHGELTLVPKVPDYIRGLMNVRGDAVPLLDLGRFFGLTESAEADESSVKNMRVIVVRHEDLRAGILCDRVLGIRETTAGEMRPPRATQAKKLSSHAVCELDGPEGLIVVLDLAALLEDARVR